MKKSLTVLIDETLYRELKGAVGLSGKKMAAWISDALRAALPAQKKARP